MIYDADICFTDSMKYWCGMVPPLWRMRAGCGAFRICLLTEQVDFNATAMLCVVPIWLGKQVMNHSGIAAAFAMFFPCAPRRLAVTIPVLSECFGIIHVTDWIQSSFLVAFSMCSCLFRGTYALFSRSTRCLLKDVRQFGSFDNMFSLSTCF